MNVEDQAQGCQIRTPDPPAAENPQPPQEPNDHKLEQKNRP
jgi:hypothetical protein